MRPIDIAIQDTQVFLQQALPQPRCRLLQVGCGRGELAARLMADGHPVTALEPSEKEVLAARAAGVPARQVELLAYDDSPFQAVLFASALQHLHPLDRALERTERLLAPGGLLIAEELAVEAVDPVTAAWFYSVRAMLETSGILLRAEEAPVRGDPLAAWKAEHERGAAYSTGEAMCTAIRRRFEVLRIERVPWLYRSFARELSPGECGAAVLTRLRELEASLVEQGILKPAGLRIVAQRR